MKRLFNLEFVARQVKWWFSKILISEYFEKYTIDCIHSFGKHIRKVFLIRKKLVWTNSHEITRIHADY